MSRKLLATLAPKLAPLKTEYERFVDKMADGTPLTAEEETQFAAAKTAFYEMADRLVELKETVERDDALNSKLAGIESAIGNDDKVEHAGANENLARVYTSDRPKSLAAQFIESPALKAYLGRGAIGTSGVADLSLIKSTDINGKPMAGVLPVDRGQVQPTRTTPLLDACYIEMVSSNEYFWEEWPLNAPVAGDVPEGEPAAEAVDDYEMKTGSLGKAAHHIPATREGLEDNSALESKIEGRLMWGVRNKAELKTYAAITAATLPTATHADGLLQAIRIGMAEAISRGFQAIDLVANPFDLAEMDLDLLTKTLQGARANSPKWELNPIEAGVVARGTAYTGSLYDAVSVYARNQVQMWVTDSHASDFISEKLRIMARQRLSAHVTQPNALIECTAAVNP